MKKKKNNLSVYKKDSVGLFSGRYKKQVFKGKKDKIKIQERKQKFSNYQEEIF